MWSTVGAAARVPVGRVLRLALGDVAMGVVSGVGSLCRQAVDDREVGVRAPLDGPLAAGVEVAGNDQREARIPRRPRSSASMTGFTFGLGEPLR